MLPAVIAETIVEFEELVTAIRAVTRGGPGAGRPAPSGPIPIGTSALLPGRAAAQFVIGQPLRFGGPFQSPFLGNRQPPGSPFFRSELTEIVRRRGAAEAKRLAEESAKAAQGLDILRQSVVTNFSQMAAAALSGSQQMEQVVISAFTNILSSIKGISPFGGALIGAIGGLLGGLFGRRNDPVPVKMVDVTDGVFDKARRIGPDRIEITIIDPRTNVRRIIQEIRSLEARDGVARIPVSFGF